MNDQDKEAAFREIWSYYGDEKIIEWLEAEGYEVSKI